jgi:hypothetical protein
MFPRDSSVPVLYSFGYEALLKNKQRKYFVKALFTDYMIIKLILGRDPIKGIIQDLRVPVTTLQYHWNAVGYLYSELSGFTCTYI